MVEPQNRWGMWQAWQECRPAWRYGAGFNLKRTQPQRRREEQEGEGRQKKVGRTGTGWEKAGMAGPPHNAAEGSNSLRCFFFPSSATRSALLPAAQRECCLRNATRCPEKGHLWGNSMLKVARRRMQMLPVRCVFAPSESVGHV